MISAALALFPADSGQIVNIGSVAGELPPAAAAVYAGTKGAVHSITRSLAKELGRAASASTPSTLVPW